MARRKKKKISLASLCANKIPIIDSGGTLSDGQVVELVDQQIGGTEDPLFLHQSVGTIKFIDPNAADVHTASILPPPPGYLGTLTLGPVNQALNTVSWVFQVQDGDIDFLKQGETKVQTYSVVINDGKGGSVTQVVKITIVGRNDAPTADDETNTTAEDTTLTVSGAAGVDPDNLLTGDTDDEGVANLSITTFMVAGDLTVYNAGQVATIPGVGTLQINADGTYEFIPAPNYNGPVPVATYTVIDSGAPGLIDQGTLTITITPVDDSPTAGTGAASVDDDGLLNGNPLSVIGDLPDPNTDGDNDETTFSDTLPFSYGGDGPGSVTFAAMGGLTGQPIGQETVKYTWNGGTGTLTATVDDGGPRDGTDLFQIVVNTLTGAYTLTLLDNILHAAGPDDETNDITIPLTFTVTDGNGTAVPGTLNVTFDDDGPTAQIALNGQTMVIIDETAGDDGDSDDKPDGPLAPLFAAILATPIEIAQNTTALVTTAGSATGADGGTTVISLEVSAAGVASGLETTNGRDIFLFKEGALIVGRAETSPGSGVNPAGAVAFAIAIDATTGVVTVAQYLSLKHDDTGDFDEADDDGTNANDAAPDDTPDPIQQVIASGAVSAKVTVTDGDGDVATASVDIGGAIKFQDDGPTAAIALNGQNMVIIDETAGDDAGSNDILGAPNTPVPAAFAAILATPIEIAQNATALVTTTGSSFGADGPGGTVISLDISAAGVNSGLKTTNGRSIFLYMLGALVVGRAEASPGSGADPAGAIAFAVSIDASGVVTVAQYLSIQHDDKGDFDEANDDGTNANDASPDDSPEPVQQMIANSAIVAKNTVTDGDGDVATATVAIGNLIKFEDDGPTEIFPDHAVLVNTTMAGGMGTFELDLDTNVDPNFGADGGTVRFAASLDGANSGLTSGGQPIVWDVVDDQHLVGKVGATTIITVTLNLDGSAGLSNDTYTVTVLGTIDGATGTTVFVPEEGNFQGGNDPWAGFFDNPAVNNDSTDILLTPIPQATVNTNANAAGISGGASIGSGEAIRIDVVRDLTGNPAGAGGYSVPANRDHVFEQHLLTNNLAVGITGINAASDSDIRFKAFDDPDGNNVVGDGAGVSISAVTIFFNNDNLTITQASIGNGNPQNFTIGGHLFQVEFQLVGGVVEAVVRNVVDDTKISVTGLAQYDSLEVHHDGGDTFQIDEFGLTTVTTGVPVNFALPIEVVDGDGDTLSTLLGITLAPTGTTNFIGDDTSQTLTGNATNNVLYGDAGNDTLIGGDGSDQLIGGLGTDSLEGGNGNDTYVFDLVDGTDTIDDTSGTDRIIILTGGTALTALNFLDSSTTNNNGNLVITYNANQITIENYYSTNILETISFDGGTYLGYSLGTGAYSVSLDENDPLDEGAGLHIIAGATDGTTLDGGAGNDLLFGNAANDTLVGGADTDLLVGGAGSDIFRFAAGDSGQTEASVDVIGDYAKGADVFDFSVAMTIGGSAAAATATEASINATTGVATFDVGSGSGTTLGDALSDIAARFQAATTSAGEFALFQVNGTGDYYIFISDGVDGVGINDVVARLSGVTSVASISISGGGDLTIVA